MLPAIRGAQLYGFLDGSAKAPAEKIEVEQADKTVVSQPNPAYAAWVAQDQQVLSYLVNSLSREVLGQIVTYDTASGVWQAIHGMFASQSRSRVILLRNKLSTTRKGDMSCANYYARMKGYADEMAAAGKRLEDDEVISYILAGLDSEYNPCIESVCARVDPISLSDLYAQLLSTEARIASQ